ncbi:RnfH family protein [Neisseria canis]|uniref:UPF0125 protein NCTC10296_02233 n=1 Tax=Neisseria canis TaxID=493 RepID=A0A1X3CTA1_9NEIS|nr:RnfH family protein [Neisseria canis]OSI10776.1 RnfH family protein [Neisseria canis]VEF03271.1 Protein rnfH [Neisseria canis]
MDKITIEIVYGTAERQHLQRMQVESGTTARQAVIQSEMAGLFPQADIADAPLGIFGKQVKDDTVLRHNDRVEIYRPLLIDPKEARRLRVSDRHTATNKGK